MGRVLSDNYIAMFLGQLGLLVKAGVTLDESVEMMYKSEKDGESKELLKSIFSSLLEGKELNIALSETDVFPSYMVKMIKVGEATGKLEETINTLKDYYERSDRMNTQIKNAIVYPLVLTIMMLSVIVILMTKVMPIFNEVYEQMGSSLSGFSAIILSIGSFLNRYGVFVLGVVLILAVLLFVAVKTGKFKKMATEKFENTQVYKEILQSRFTSVLAMALGSGLNVDEAMEMAGETLEDTKISETIKIIRDKMLEGADFSELLEESGLLSSVDTRFVSIGMKVGNIDSVMKQIADRNEEDAMNHIDSIVGKIEPCMIMILAVITGAILLSVMIPLSNLITLIG